MFRLKQLGILRINLEFSSIRDVTANEILELRAELNTHGTANTTGTILHASPDMQIACAVTAENVDGYTIFKIRPRYMITAGRLAVLRAELTLRMASDIA